MKLLSLFLLVAMAFIPRLAQADGGIVRVRDTRGPFVITIFTPSEVMTDAPAEVSVMVQDRETSMVVMDALVELSLVQRNNSTKQAETDSVTSMTDHAMRGDWTTMDKPLIIRATAGRGTNKLLYSASVVYPIMGDWSLHVSVRRGRSEEIVDCIVPVALAGGRLADLWPYLAVIPVAIALFALNQWLRRRSANSIAIQATQMTS